MALDSTWSWRTSFVNHSLRARKKVPTITRSGTSVRRRTKQKHRLEAPRIDWKPTQVFIKLERLPPGALYPASCYRVGEISPVKIFAALSRFVHRPEPPAPSAAPFDDGLIEIARLIAREESVRDGAEARRSRSGA